MKFRMAPNSLFAILLRSPWWASLLVALGIALLSRALLPPDYVVFGALAAVPFIAITGMAGWRQWNTPSQKRVAETLESAALLSWNAFADALSAGFRRDGYTVSTTDGKQVDLRLEKNGHVSLVSARRWKAARHGAEPMKELHSAVKATFADEGIYVALGELSDNARTEAASAGLRVLAGAELARLLTGLVPPAARKG